MTRDLIPLITNCIGYFVSTPEAVKVRRLSDSSAVFEVEVEGDELGMIIGRKGHHIDAVRDFIKVVGTANGYRNIEISLIE